MPFTNKGIWGSKERNNTELQKVLQHFKSKDSPASQRKALIDFKVFLQQGPKSDLEIGAGENAVEIHLKGLLKVPGNELFVTEIENAWKERFANES